jgi:hypothetical protein
LVLAEPIGELAETLAARAQPGEPSPLASLIAARRRRGAGGTGSPDRRRFFMACSTNTLSGEAGNNRDIWTVLPYENFLVTAELDPLALKVMMEEAFESRESRSLAGFRFSLAGEGLRRLTDLRLADGRPPRRGPPLSHRHEHV